MAYLGRQPNTGVRSRYIFTATASQTTFSGTDDDGKTLKYEDAAYVDVFLNGVLLKPVTDYAATTKTSVVLTSAAAASDIVEIVAYDIANIADTVSKANGGTFDAGVTVTGDLTVDTNTLYVDSTNNRVGVGTVSPSSLLDVDKSQDAETNIELTNTNAGSSAQVRTKYTTDGGLFTVGKTSDAHVYGGDAYVYNVDNTNIRFATNDTERARLTNDGKLLSGTSSTFDNVSFLGIQSLGGLATKINGTAATTQVSFFNDNGRVGYIGTSGTSTSYNTSSDYRLKEDWYPISDATVLLKSLNPVNFAWKSDGNRVDGFLAHEVSEVVPEAVSGTKDEVDAEGNPVYQGIDQSKLVPLLTAALQEAISKIEALEARVATLENA